MDVNQTVEFIQSMIKVIYKLPQTSTGKIKRNDLQMLIKEKNL